MSETWLLNLSLNNAVRVFYVWDGSASAESVTSGNSDWFIADYSSPGPTTGGSTGNYSFMGVDYGGIPAIGATSYATLVYESGAWKDETYRTVTFETAPSGDLLAWLQANGTKQASSQLSVDITTLPKYHSIPLGTHKLTIVASAPGYLDSDPSQEATFINGYPITFNVTNCTYSPSATMVAVFEPTTFIFTKSTGYSLPSSISVTGVASDKYTWTVASDGLTATLVITEPTNAVTVTVTAVIESYAVNYDLTNCTAYSGNPTSISSDASGIQFRINKAEHYKLPQDIGDITVSNAKLDSWVLSTDGTYGTATISAPTGDITIKLEGIAEVYSITVSAPHTTHTGATTITYGQTATLTFTFDTGYEAPDAVTVNGATGTWTKSTGTLVLSGATGNVSVSLTAVAKTYAIRVNGTNATVTSGSPTTIKYGGTATLSFNYDRGYFAPTSVRVDNATGNWDQDTNELVITNPDDTGDVIVTIEAIEKTYDIKYALTNLTAASSNPTAITSAATGVELTISGTTYYALPTSITVSGVATGDWSYDQATGKVTLSYPTGTVTITAVGVEISETIDGIWSWNTTIPDGVWTEQAVNFTSNGGSYSGIEWDGYDLYYIVAADGTKQKVYSFNEDTQVGTWADGGERSYWRIVDFGTTGETVSKIFADYVSANAVLSGKLATPTGVQVADDEASWNEVENAAQYEIVVDNASWGTYVPAVYDYTFDESTGVLTLSDAPYEQTGDTVTITDDSTVIVTKAAEYNLSVPILFAVGTTTQPYVKLNGTSLNKGDTIKLKNNDVIIAFCPGGKDKSGYYNAGIEVITKNETKQYHGTYDTLNVIDSDVTIKVGEGTRYAMNMTQANCQVTINVNITE